MRTARARMREPRHRENPARLPRRRGQRGAKRPRAEAEGGRGNDSDDEGD